MNKINLIYLAALIASTIADAPYAPAIPAPVYGAPRIELPAPKPIATTYEYRIETPVVKSAPYPAPAPVYGAPRIEVPNVPIISKIELPAPLVKSAPYPAPAPVYGVPKVEVPVNTKIELPAPKPIATTYEYRVETPVVKSAPYPAPAPVYGAPKIEIPVAPKIEVPVAPAPVYGAPRIELPAPKPIATSYEYRLEAPVVKSAPYPAPAPVYGAPKTEIPVAPKIEVPVVPAPVYGAPKIEIPVAPKIEVPVAPAPVYGAPRIELPAPKPIATSYEYRLEAPVVKSAPYPAPAPVYGVPKIEIPVAPKIDVPVVPAPVYGVPRIELPAPKPIATTYEYRLETPAVKSAPYPAPAPVYGVPKIEIPIAPKIEIPIAPAPVYGAPKIEIPVAPKIEVPVAPAPVYGAPRIELPASKPIATTYEYRLETPVLKSALYPAPAPIYGAPKIEIPVAPKIEAPVIPAPVYGAPRIELPAPKPIATTYEYRVETPLPKIEVLKSGPYPAPGPVSKIEIPVAPKIEAPVIPALVYGEPRIELPAPKPIATSYEYRVETPLPKIEVLKSGPYPAPAPVSKIEIPIAPKIEAPVIPAPVYGAPRIELPAPKPIATTYEYRVETPLPKIEVLKSGPYPAPAPVSKIEIPVAPKIEAPVIPAPVYGVPRIELPAPKPIATSYEYRVETPLPKIEVLKSGPYPAPAPVSKIEIPIAPKIEAPVIPAAVYGAPRIELPAPKPIATTYEYRVETPLPKIEVPKSGPYPAPTPVYGSPAAKLDLPVLLSLNQGAAKIDFSNPSLALKLAKLELPAPLPLH